MVEVGQIVFKKGEWKNHYFTVHITKVRLYMRERDRGLIRDPKDLPSFVLNEMGDLLTLSWFVGGGVDSFLCCWLHNLIPNRSLGLYFVEQIINKIIV